MSHDPHHETPSMHDKPDDWHTHTADEPTPQAAHVEKVNAPLIIGVGLGLFLVVVITVVILYQYAIWYTADLADRRLNDPNENVAIEEEQLALKAAARAALDADAFTWVDHDRVQAPLTEAMDLIVEEYAGRN